MRTTLSSMSLLALALLASGCASTPAAAPASMSIMPQPCVSDTLQYPDPCAHLGPGYYDSTPYTYYPFLVAPFYPVVLPTPAPVNNPPAPPPPPAHPGKPPAKHGRPRPREKPCPRNGRPCP